MTEYEGAASIPAGLASQQSWGAFGIPLSRRPYRSGVSRKGTCHCGEGLLHAQASFGLTRPNVGRARALLALSDFEIDCLALIERNVARRFELRMVDEQIRAAIRRPDEAESLTCIEPFYGTFCHVSFS